MVVSAIPFRIKPIGIPKTEILPRPSSGTSEPGKLICGLVNKEEPTTSGNTEAASTTPSPFCRPYTCLRKKIMTQISFSGPQSLPTFPNCFIVAVIFSWNRFCINRQKLGIHFGATIEAGQVIGRSILLPSSETCTPRFCILILIRDYLALFSVQCLADCSGPTLFVAERRPTPVRPRFLS